MKFIQFFFINLFLLFSGCITAQRVVNVYVWGGEIPKQVIRQFEQETNIKVNFSTYDSNETLFAKLKASSSTIYDVILPSGYYVERMKKQNMLLPLDHHLLPNLSHLAPQFIKADFDPGNHFSIPLIWGTTGIFYNRNQVIYPPLSWQSFWDKRWAKKLMLLDDSREIFGIVLMSLGYSPNDENPQHIYEAFQQLLKLVPNVKLFASDSIQAIMIDEDAIAGTAWNGDAFKAHVENKKIEFVYPREGFVIWVDSLAIPNNPPHLKEAYEFINFLLKPEIASQIALIEGHAVTNQTSLNQLPLSISQNPTVYPALDTLHLGHFQRDVSDSTLTLYNQYWQQFKLAF